ncbi:MAG TPA: DUF5666 domain-containing protein [Beijerinckiaceae bacterium]|nr:DUF5666 domain-containing protein [Beijerinckiaceae bacterium]
MISRRLLIGVTFCLATAIAPALAQAPTTNVRVKGTVDKLDGNALMVKTADGSDSTVTLADKYLVRTVVKLTPADIKAGDYLGVGAKPQPDGTLRAIQITIFPEAQRGVGEGHGAWSALPDSTMTNGTASATVQSVDGPTLTVTYKGGDKKLVIPADARVISYAAADKADLKPGAQVLVTAAKHPDGSLTSATVTVAKNGVALPL